MPWEPINKISENSHISNVLFEGQYVMPQNGRLLDAPVKYCVGTIEYGKPITSFNNGIKTVRFKPLGIIGSQTKERRD